MTNITSATKIHWVRLTKGRILLREKRSVNLKIQQYKLIKIKHQEHFFLSYNSDYRTISSNLTYLQLESKKEGVGQKKYLKKNNNQNYSKYDVIYIPTDTKQYAVYKKATLNIIDVNSKRKKRYMICKH